MTQETRQYEIILGMINEIWYNCQKSSLNLFMFYFFLQVIKICVNLSIFLLTLRSHSTMNKSIMMTDSLNDKCQNQL